MKYKVLDKELLEIRSIENIESITISNILDPSSKSNKTLLGIIVNGNKKFYHYLETDRYFDEYLKHLMEQYQKEKATHPIAISKELIPIFEQELTLEEENELSPFLQLPSFKEQKIKYEKTKIDKIRNILFYELQTISSIIENEEKYDSIKGYRNLWELKGIKNKESITYPLRIEFQNDFNYHILVENFFQAGNGLILNISYRGNKIIIHWENEKETISGYHELEFQEGNGIERAMMYENGKCIYIDSQNLVSNNIEEEEEKKIKSLLHLFHIEGDFQITKLPWNDYHLERYKIERQEEEEKKTAKQIDLVIQDKNVYLTYIKLTRLKSFKTNYQLTVDGRKSIHHATMNDQEENYGIIESRFYKDSFASSSYKLQLEDKYFYEYFETEKSSFHELTSLEAKPITHLKESDKGYKLIKRRELKKIQEVNE